MISISPNLPEGADRVGGQLRGDKECPFSGVTNSGRVWGKVPESDVQSVECPQRPSPTPSIAFRHLPPKDWRKTVVNQCMEFGVPLEEDAGKLCRPRSVDTAYTECRVLPILKDIPPLVTHPFLTIVML